MLSSPAPRSHSWVNNDNRTTDDTDKHTMAQSVWWQYCLPQQRLSKLLGWLADWRGGKIKDFAIRRFSRHFKVDLSEAAMTDYRQYPTFNAFFTRELRQGARPIAADPLSLVSPVDGTVSEMGQLQQDSILQAKGKQFSLTSLLGGNTELAAYYSNGSFLTAYLSPRDYHRIHFPCDAKLKFMRYIPGKLFSVNERSVAQIERLFARNERVVCQFDNCILVAVGAMVVGSIVTAWHGVVNNPHRQQMRDWHYQSAKHQFQRGDELGYFKLGSTIILLFPPHQVTWQPGLVSGAALKMGQTIGTKK